MRRPGRPATPTATRSASAPAASAWSWRGIAPLTKSLISLVAPS